MPDRRRRIRQETQELAASQPRATVAEWTRPGSKWAKVREAQAVVDEQKQRERERLERYKREKLWREKMQKEADERDAARFVAMLESAIIEIDEEDEQESLAEALLEIKKAGL